MHELSISSAIIETAIRHAAGRKVTVVHVRVGALRQVVPSSLEFYFGIAGRDTLCEDAELDLELVRALLRCPRCANEWDPEPAPLLEGDPDPALLLPRFRCPGCDSAGAEVLAGEELMVDSIDVETAAPEATASAAATGATASGNGRAPIKSPNTHEET
jgi:hydrogenase nickel incorporation protein HypA/HybF